MLIDGTAQVALSLLGAAPYNAGTTYDMDALVISLGRLYYSLQADNMANTPSASPTFWQATTLLDFVNTRLYSRGLG